MFPPHRTTLMLHPNVGIVLTTRGVLNTRSVDNNHSVFEFVLTMVLEVH